MTVGKLKDILSKFDDNMTVALGGDGFYEIEEPFTEEEIEVKTAEPNNDVDVKEGEQYVLIRCCLHD